MDAVDFLMKKARFCKDKFCQDCEILDECNDLERGITKDRAERMIDIIEQWVKEHPVKTRQSEFLKMFPNAKLSLGVLNINSCEIDSTIKCQCNGKCHTCRRDYWLNEVETEKSLEEMDGKKDGV